MRDATGAIYLTFQHSGQQRVIRRDVSGVTMPIALPQTVSGRGQLAVFGSELVLVAWNEAEGKAAGICYIQPISGYVAPAGPATPGGVAPERAEPLPNDGAPYLDNAKALGSNDLTVDHTWRQYLDLGKFAARLNKLVAALAQLQRLARQAGWIKD